MSDSEDEQDWSKFIDTVQTTVIPKKGEKGFEPTLTNYDQHLLDQKREAMYSTIESSNRGHYSKNCIVAYWDLHQQQPGIAVVEKLKGSALNSMGVQSRNRVYLQFEEALYLIERGSLECYLVNGDNKRLLSLQSAYGVMIPSGAAYDMFFVYSFLKRYGYIVRRASFGHFYTSPASVSASSAVSSASTVSPSSAIAAASAVSAATALSSFTSLFNSIIPSLQHLFNAFIPSSHASFLTALPWHSFLSWKFLYKTLSVIEKKPLTPQSNDQSLEIVYDVWKPGRAVKSAPDYQLAIINSSENMPTLSQLQHLHLQCFDWEKVLIAMVDNGVVNFVRMRNGLSTKNVFLDKKRAKRHKRK